MPSRRPRHAPAEHATPEIGIVTKTTPYPLARANQALADLRAGKFEGAAAVLVS
jgi:hypothetical protein